ncbi:filamentous hemagglutinin N-terminal domain-containing protein [Tolypothrix tenuis]|uniref:two-partner secretion domain-containing protein n=1 Tax=Tolypothrix tenuis TaxID=457083 RepID=UPI002AA530C7
MKQRGIKQSKCDRTSFHEGFWRILATISLQPKLILCSLILFSCAPAYSQINPDNTLGAESSRVTPNVLINGANADKIDGGAIRGSNLFHSFSEFNINDGQRVYFGNPAGVQNILTRVTGGQASNILGTLGVNGTANLFLINPNGILFGKNAQLDIRGSFLGTTANSLLFPNGVEFSATNPQAPPLLAINVPIGLQFGSQPKSITSQAVDGLGIDSGSTLALIGGEIKLDNTLLFALDSQIKLGAVGGDTTVGLNFDNSSLGFSLPDNAIRAPIKLTNGALIATLGDSAIELVGGQIGLNGSRIFGINGSSIFINANQVDLDNSSNIFTSTDSSSKAGNIQIQASDTVSLANGSRLFSGTIGEATGNGGDINISAKNIEITRDETTRNASIISTLNLGQGNGGNLTLDATELIGINGGSVFVATGGAGNGGNLTVQAGNTVNITNGSSISVQTDGVGNGGNLTVQAGNTVNVTNGGSALMFSDSSGNTGNLLVRAGNTVNVTDTGKLWLSSKGSGSTGNLHIETGTFRIQNTGNLGGVGGITTGSGRIGSVSIQARDAVEVVKGVIAVGVLGSGAGQAGDITVETPRVNLRDGGHLTTSTFINKSTNNGGNIVIRASESVDIRGVSVSSPDFILSGVSSMMGFGATGNGGNVTIETPRLTLSQGAEISTSSLQSQGNAGNITIRAKDVELDGFVIVPNQPLSPKSQLPFGNLYNLVQLQPEIFGLTGIRSQVLGSDINVQGGIITIDTERLRLSNGAEINTSVAVGSGQGGNLAIRAIESIDITGVGPKRLNGSPAPSGLFAELQTGAIGSGGSINIETGRLNINDGGKISTSTFNQGNAGNIAIRATQVSLRGQRSSIGTQVDDEAKGNAGNISISAQRLNVEDGAEISSATQGNGNAGNLTVQSEKIEITGFVSGLFSSVAKGANGKGGNLSITTNRLVVSNGAEVASRTLGNGEAGDLTIKASDSVEVVGTSPDDSSNSLLSTFTTGASNAGRLTIDTRHLSIRNGAYINASTGGSGRGGDIDINATDSVEIIANPADQDFADGIFTSTAGSGNAGDLTLSTKHLSIRNGGVISASTGIDSTGRGGNINIHAFDSVEIAGISNDSRLPSSLSVRSLGTGEAGNISVDTPRFTLSDRGKINAESNAVDGGNITLNTDLLLLLRNSTISATAGLNQSAGNGGNIFINSPFIIAVPNENSDISANAFTGKGGNVNITTQAIFGIAARPQQTNQSDITASSELGVQGEIIFTQPQVQPPQKLLELPSGLVNATTQFAQTCPRGPNAKPLGSFVITGRGSLPPNSFEPLTGTTSLSPLASLDGENADTKQPIVETDAQMQVDAGNSSQIVEAQGLVKTADGKIMLVAEVPTATPAATSSSAMCPKS